MRHHPLDAVSLVFGIVFTAVGLVTLAASEVPLTWFDARAVLPVVAVLAGLWLLAGALRRDRDGEPAESTVGDDERPGPAESTVGDDERPGPEESTARGPSGAPPAD